MRAILLAALTMALGTASVGLAACGTTERTVVVTPSPGSTVVVPPSN